MEHVKKAIVGFLQDPLSYLWRFWASERVSGALFVLVLLAGLLMLTFPQKPAGIEGNPAAYGRWLADVRSRLGEQHELFHSLGLLDVGHSFGLRLLCALLAFNAILGLAEYASRLQIALRHRSQEPEERQEWRIPSAISGSLSRLSAYLERRGWLIQSPEEGIEFVGWRFPWGGLFILLVYAGLVLTLLGLAANDRWGWLAANLPVSEGQVLSIGHGKNFDLRNDGVQVAAGASRRLGPGWSSLVAVLSDGQDLAKFRLQGAWPRYFRGLLFRQTGYGPSFLIDAVTGDGQPVALSVRPSSPNGRSGTELRFRDTGDEGYLLVPTANLTFRLTYYANAPWQNVDGPVIHIQAIRSGQAEPVWEASVQGDGSWDYQGITYRARSQYYAILRIDFVPGLLVSVGGLLMLLVGLIGASVSPPVYSIRATYGEGEYALLLTGMTLIRGPIARRRLARLHRDIASILSA